MASPHIELAPAPAVDDIIVSDGVSDKVRVWIRIRPPLKSEIAKEEVVHIDPEDRNSTKILIEDGVHTIKSHYDQVFSKDSYQEEIFEFTRPAISGVIDGFNCTVFAYGQTGSGKTHTMFGPKWESSVNGSASNLSQYLKQNGLK